MLRISCASSWFFFTRWVMVIRNSDMFCHIYLDFFIVTVTVLVYQVSANRFLFQVN